MQHAPGADDESHRALLVSRRVALQRLAVFAILLIQILSALAFAGLATFKYDELAIHIPGLAFYSFGLSYQTLVLIICAALVCISLWLEPIRRCRIFANYPLADLLVVTACSTYVCLGMKYEAMLAIPIILGANAVAWVLARLPVSDRVARKFSIPDSSAGKIIIFGITLILLAGLGWWMYAGIPYVVDSASEMFHAKLFQRGLFKLPPPPYPEFFKFANVVVGDPGWFSFYPPGHILLIALFDRWGLSFLINPILGAGAAVALFLFCARNYGRGVAALSLLLLLISPFFQLMQSGLMSHGGTLFYGIATLAIASHLSGLKRQKLWSGVAGFLVGYAAITRPLTAVALFLPLFLYTLRYVLPALRERVGCIVAAVAGVSVPLIFLFYFNTRTTGAPFLMSYQVSKSEFFQLGFGGAFTPLAGLANSLNNIYAMNSFLLGFGSGSFLFIGLHVILGRWTRVDWLMLAMPISLSVAYMFYGYQDFWYGPRFLYEALPCLIVLSARGIQTCGAALTKVFARPLHVGKFAVLATIVLCAFLAGIPTLQRHHDASLNQRVLLADLRPILHDRNAVVFIDDVYSYTVYPYNARFPDGPLFLQHIPGRDEEAIQAMPGYTFHLYAAGKLVPYPTISAINPMELTAL